MRNLHRRSLAALAALAVAMSTVVGAPAFAVGLDSATIRTNVETQLALENGRYSVAVKEIGGDTRSFGISQHRSLEPASSIKVFYAWMTLERVDQGTLRLGSSLPSGTSWGDCLRVMILVSDNLCAADIREALGNATINERLHQANFDDTRILLDGESSYAGKVTSAHDLTEFFLRLNAGTLLSDTSTTKLVRLLRLQVWRSRLASGTPEGIVVASKPGILRIASGMVQADAGLIRGEASTYVITVLGDRGATRAAIRRVSRIVYEGLNDVTGYTAASYPLRQFEVVAGTTMSDTVTGPPSVTIRRDRPVELLTTERLRALIRVGNLGDGWVDFKELILRDAYRWMG